LERQRRAYSAAVVSAVHNAQRRHDPSAQLVTPQRILSWVEEAPPEEIARTLSGLGPSEANSLIEAIRPYHQSAPSRKPRHIAEYLELIAALGGSRQRLRDRIRSAVHHHPGDWFFLNSISSTRANGYMACLRLIREIREPAIAVRWDALEKSEARRIARLRSP